MESIDSTLAEKFSCAKCGHLGARVERLAMAGTGISRWLNIAHHEYAFVSCANCGYTEVYNLRALKDHDLEESASTRLLVYTARLMNDGFDAMEACRAALIEPLSDDEATVDALMEVVRAKFG